MTGFFEALLEVAGLYYGERIKNPLVMDPPLISKNYPREQTVIASPTNESKYQRRARRRHTRRRLTPTHRDI
jgi:hypothetical protein